MASNLLIDELDDRRLASAVLHRALMDLNRASPCVGRSLKALQAEARAFFFDPEFADDLELWCGLAEIEVKRIVAAARARVK